MKNCNKCGTQVTDDVKFCPNCGASEFTQNASDTQTAPVQPEVMDGDYDVNSNKGIAWLSYVGLLLLIPMLVKKASSYCKFHVMQGAKLFAVILVYTTITEIIKGIVYATTGYETVWGVTFHYHSGLYWFFNWTFAAGSIFLCVVSIIGIVNAATGKRNVLPLIDKVPFVDNLMEKIYTALNK